MKKIFAVLAISAFLFSCGDSASTESNTNSEEVAPATEAPAAEPAEAPAADSLAAPAAGDSAAPAPAAN